MQKKGNHCHERELWKGLAAGLIAGAAASWTMNQFQTAWSKLSARRAKEQDSQPEQQEEAKTEEQEPATVKAASAASKRLFHHDLTDREKKTAGPAVHYGFGTAMGGLYGALAGVAPPVTKGAGMPFGAFLWLAADEGAVPALGFSEPPTKYPMSSHLYALASHLVYGLTAEMVRRAVLHAWKKE